MFPQWTDSISFAIDTCIKTGSLCYTNMLLMGLHNKILIGCLLVLVLVFLNYHLLRSHRVEAKNKPNPDQFRKRDRFYYYGQKILRSFRSYTTTLNRRQAIFKLTSQRQGYRRMYGSSGSGRSLYIKRIGLPRCLLDVDSESTESMQGDGNMWPYEVHYLLKNVRVFGHFDKPIIFNLCRFVATKFIPAGAYLFRIGDADDLVYVVQKGQLQVTLTENERNRYTIKTCGAGDSVFSLLSIADYLCGIKGRFDSLSCKALSDCIVTVLPFQAFVDVLSDYPQSLVRFVQTILMRFRRITYMTLHDHLGLRSELTQADRVVRERFEHVLLRRPASRPQEESAGIARSSTTPVLPGAERPSLNDNTSDFQAAFAVAHRFCQIDNALPHVEPFIQSDSESEHSEYAEFDACEAGMLKEAYENIEGDLGLKPSSLHNRLTIHTVSKNTLIVIQGQSSEKIVALIKGSMVAICRDSSNANEAAGGGTHSAIKREKHMFTVLPREFCGVLSVLTGEPELYTLRATEKCVIGVIQKEDVYGILHDQPTAVLSLMQSITERISSFVRKVDFGMEWTFFESGKAIYRQGNKPDYVYVILNGRIRRIYADETREHERHLLGEHGRGETLGFLEAFMDIPRQSTVMAIRDTETAQISNGLLNYLRTVNPSVLTNFMHMARQTFLGSNPPLSPIQSDTNIDLDSEFIGKRNQNLSTVAVFPINERVPIDQFTIALVKSLRIYGSVSHLTQQSVLRQLGSSTLSPVNEHRLLAWLSQQEELHRLVVYQCSSGNRFDTWSRRCVRQADCVLAVGIFWTSPEVTGFERLIQEHSIRAQKELVLLHRQDECRLPRGTANWLRNRRYCSSHHHIRCPSYFFEQSDETLCPHHHQQELSRSLNAADHSGATEASSLDSAKSTGSAQTDSSCRRGQLVEDISRLARFLMGRSVGVALGGGGAKGIAHIGIIDEMLKKGVPIDMIGGTSIGGFIGGLFASRLSIDYCSQQTEFLAREMTSYKHKLLDITYPIVAMFTGSVFNRVIKGIFEDTQIEDLWIPFFCVTTDISDSNMRVHSSGVLWRYLRASMSYSTMVPPVCDPLDSHLLLDGCYVNNVPADIVRRLGAHQVIAVDVGSRDETDFTNYGDSLSGWWLLWKKLNPWTSAVKIPDMAEIQSRLAYVSCQRQLEYVKRLERCQYIRPPIDRFGSLQFRSFQEIKEVGHACGKAVFHNWVPEGNQGSQSGAGFHDPAVRSPSQPTYVDMCDLENCAMEVKDLIAACNVNEESDDTSLSKDTDAEEVICQTQSDVARAHEDVLSYLMEDGRGASVD